MTASSTRTRRTKLSSAVSRRSTTGLPQGPRLNVRQKLVFALHCIAIPLPSIPPSGPDPLQVCERLGDLVVAGFAQSPRHTLVLIGIDAVAPPEASGDGVTST